MTTVWVDGRLGDGATSTISAVDHGLTVGDGVFETCLVLDSRPVALTRHLRRLARSAAAMGLELPADGRLGTAVDEVLAAEAELPLGRLRITVTGGAGPLGSDRGGAEPSLIVAATATRPWPAEPTAVTVPWTRNERSAVAGVKTTSYAENVVALGYARQQGASEAILGNTRGELCEGTGSNILVVLDGQLLTPPLSSGCLAGITRELLLEWADLEGLPIVEKDLPLDVLAEADDVLLTSSTRGIQRQARVDGRTLPASPEGTTAIELYSRRLARDLDP